MSKDRLMELQRKHLNGEIKEDSSEYQERRRLFFQHCLDGDMYEYDEFGNKNQMFSNMRPCLEDCDNCNKKRYINGDNINEDGHTGWGVIGSYSDMRDNCQHHFSFCSETCWNEYRDKTNKAWNKFINKSYSDFSEMMDVKEFEEFTLWYSNGFLKSLSEEEITKMSENNLLMATPYFFSLELRKHILPYMNEYVEYIDSGYTISHSGRYTFKKPVPKSEVLRIIQQS